MTCTKETEQYIFNCLKKFNPLLKAYKEDVLQEIRYALLVCPDEREALRMSKRNCDKMLRQYGYNSERAKETYKALCLSAQYKEESGNDALETIGRLYSTGCPIDEICRRFGATYDKKMNALFIAAFAGGGDITTDYTQTTLFN